MLTLTSLLLRLVTLSQEKGTNRKVGTLFCVRRDSNPERVPSVKQNSLNNCFVARWCEDGYRKATPFGRRTRNTRQRIHPFGRAKKKTIANAIVFFSYIRLAASYIALQSYLDFVQVVFASRVLAANIISPMRSRNITFMK